MGASWNSFPLEIAYETLGWMVFLSWSICAYPQVFLNWRRKSVVGLSFDFVVLDLTKHSSYLIYNATLYFSSTVQQQYRVKYGLNQMIPVAANDVALSTHAVILTLFTLFQISIYERGTQKLSNISILIVTVVWIAAGICVFIAVPTHSWLWLISVFNTIQVIMTVIKYTPQAYLNFTRKSTEGFSIGTILLDFMGGVTSYGQMTVQSIDQNSWVNFYGNMGKTLLSLISVFSDALFICQHYMLYPSSKKTKPLLLPSKKTKLDVSYILEKKNPCSAFFRTAYSDAQLPPENLREFLPRLIPVLLSNMVYADDDESLAEAEEDETVPDKEQDIKPPLQDVQHQQTVQKCYSATNVLSRPIFLC